MSYLIRCDVCGKEFRENEDEVRYRLEVFREQLDLTAKQNTRHVCKACYPEFERFISVLSKRKEE